MAEKKLLTELIPIRELALWAKNGNMAVSVKNGYPRFTYFNKDKSKGNLSAPMKMQTFMIVAGLIERVGNSKESVKYELLCSNRDYTTKEKILQSVLVIARKGNDVLLGLKKNRDVNLDPEDMCKIELDREYHSIYTNNVESTTSVENSMLAASGYAGQMRYIVNKYSYKDEGNEVPNSKREPANTTQVDDDGL